MKKKKLNISREVLEDFCRRHRIRRLALFGSALGEDFSSGSDIDVLVVFESGARVGLKFFEIEQELSQIMGQNVDLNTPNFLSHYFRDQVMSEAEDLYVRA